MTSKSDIIQAGYESLNNNTSGNPDTDYDIGILQPTEFLPLAEVVEPANTDTVQRGAQAQNARPGHTYRPRVVRGDTELDAGISPEGHDPYTSYTNEQRILGKAGVRGARGNLSRYRVD